MSPAPVHIERGTGAEPPSAVPPGRAQGKTLRSTGVFLFYSVASGSVSEEAESDVSVFSRGGLGSVMTRS